MKHKIFVEGYNDFGLIKALVHKYYQEILEPKENLINVGGNANLKSVKKLEQTEGTNLIIFDADKNLGASKKLIEDQLKEKRVTNYDIFLSPNDIDFGDIETLLERIVQPKFQGILDCWKGYEACLETKRGGIESNNNGVCTIPHTKSKIYSYLEVLHGESRDEKKKIKDPNRDFSDTRFWDLEHGALNPLLAFLDKYLTRNIK